MILTLGTDYVPTEVKGEISFEGSRYFHCPCSNAEINSSTNTRFRKVCLKLKGMDMRRTNLPLAQRLEGCMALGFEQSFTGR